nr:MAG TPA: hypothetical protein [Caudoviricetes sp.]
MPFLFSPFFCIKNSRNLRLLFCVFNLFQFA